MEYHEIFDRILRVVDDQAYTVSVERLQSPEEREALEPFSRALASGEFDPDRLRDYVRGLHHRGLIDRVKMLSAVHMIAAHPRVADWDEAARIAGEQELAALELGGPELNLNLASVDRHRGVVAYLRGHYEVALDYFARVIERDRTGDNMGNVLCALVRLAELDDAKGLFHQICETYPERVRQDLVRRVKTDPDLAALLPEVSP
ncbi:MAG: hypothetical protein H6739_14730 [Alphaproteobacteria bacterium]|nr:hypothetical protein [Alphaproteobacteria bacterium]